MTIRRVRTILVGVAGSPWYSNMYFDDEGVTPTAQENVDDVDAFWTACASMIANDISWTVEGEVPVLDETNGQLVGSYAVTAATGAGTSAGDMLPFTSQLLVRLLTSDFVAGRRVRGRIFVPGLTEDANTNGVPVAGAVTQGNTAAAALVAAGGLLVWSRPFDGDPEADPPRPARAGSKASIETVSTWNKWAVLRSRRD